MEADPVLEGLHDNIEDDASVEVAGAVTLAESDDESKELMARFEDVQLGINKSGELIKELLRQPHDEARVGSLIKYCVHLHKQNTQMHDLIVQMNNFYCK